jgi:hypothetical protein
VPRGDQHRGPTGRGALTFGIVRAHITDVRIGLCLGIAVLVTACAGSSAGPKPKTNSSEPTATYQALTISSRAAPSSRSETAMAYFPPGQEIVLFGGSDENGRGFGDTWVFDRQGWRELHPAVSPPARGQATMAYDPALRELVLYGGCSFCGAPGLRLLQDTWGFNGTTWRQLVSQRLPTFEPSPLMSWDTTGDELVLLAPPPGFGTNPPNGDFSTVGGALGRWIWASSGWTWRGSPVGPPLFIQPAEFVSEPGSTAMLYYSYQPYSGSCATGSGCGADPTGLHYSMTYTWNGRSFAKGSPTSAPKAQFVMADPRIGRVIAIAGSDVWVWTGTNWEVRASGVPASPFTAAAYDPILGDVVALGFTPNANQTPPTWLWDGETWMTTTAS